MKIVWTKKAQNRFVEILDYIQLQFGETARQSFSTKTKDFTMLLKEFPEIGTLEIPEKKIKRFSTHKSDSRILQNKMIKSFF